MGYRDSEFEVLPTGWHISELQELVENHNPKRQPLNSQERVTRQGVYPYCGANGVVDHIDDFKFDGDFVLIAEDGGYWGKHEPSSYIMRGRFWVNNHAHVVRAKDGVTTNEYLSFMLNYLNIDPFIGGDARGKLTKAVLQQIEVPHPDFPEQQRIAQVLSTVQEAIAQQKRLIRTTAELKQALMQKLFTEGLRGEALKETEIGRVPESWEVLRLDAVMNCHDGKRRPVTQSDRIPGPYPYYGASGVTDHVEGYLFDGDYLLIAEDGENLASRKLPIAFIARGKFWVNNHAHVLSMKNGNLDFYEQYIAQMEIKDYLSGTTRPKLNKGLMMTMKLPRPSVAEQNEIAAALVSCDAKRQSAERKLNTLQDLFRTLLHELMTGKVRIGEAIIH